MFSTIQKIFNRQVESSTQNVYITDIIVTQSTSATPTKKDPQELQKYIDHLLELVSEKHHKENCIINKDGSYELRPDKENHITRLCTDEHHFFTSPPFSLEEFELFVRALEKKAKLLTPNIHILLSSFSVLFTPEGNEKDARLLNMALFIEVSTTITIHPFAKNTYESEEDVRNGFKMFSQQKGGKKPSFHAAFIAPEKGALISNLNVIEVKTVGGARFLFIVEICFDHFHGHGLELLRRFRGFSDSCKILPTGLEQCVTSNIIDLVPHFCLAEPMVHADSSNTSGSIQSLGHVKKVRQEIKEERPLARPGNIDPTNLYIHNRRAPEQRFFKVHPPSELPIVPYVNPSSPKKR